MRAGSRPVRSRRGRRRTGWARWAGPGALLLALAGSTVAGATPAAAATAPGSVSVACGAAGSLAVTLSGDAAPRPTAALPAGTVLAAAYRLRDRRSGALVTAGAPAGVGAATCAPLSLSGVRFAAVSAAPRPAAVAAADLLDGTVTFVLLAAAAPASTAAVAGSGASFPFAAAFDGYLAGRSGTASVAVFDGVSGQTYSYAPGRAFVTASIVKVAILATLLRQAQDAGRQLTSGERALATRMIEDSDNSAATSLWDEVGGAPAVARFIARVPMPSTTPAGGGLWGLTTTTAVDQVALLRAVAYPTSLLSTDRRGYEQSLMEAVTSGQRWGVDSGPPAGATVALKNGWLPHGSGWVINSIGHISSGGRDYVIAVLSSGSPSMAYGMATVQGLSQLVWDRLTPPPATLYGVLPAGGASHRVEVHALSPATGYRTYSLHQASVFAAVDPGQWTFLAAPASGSVEGGIRVGDLVGIRMLGGASGRVEVHVASAASGYTVFTRHIATALGAVDPAQWQFSLGAVGGPGTGVDLVGVKIGGTASGKVEVHVLTEASGYQAYSVHTATPLAAVATIGAQWRFLDGGDGDLVCIHRTGTLSGHTELHVLSSASAFRSWILHRATVLGPTDPASWTFAMGDENGDGARDLIALHTFGGTGGHVEAHVLSGATRFATWLVQSVTPATSTPLVRQWSAA